MSTAEAELREVALLLAERRIDLTDLLVERFGELIPELPRDPALVELLNGSAGANLETLVHVLRGHVPVEEIQAPAAATEYARRLAQRGTPPSALLRAYRLGQQLILRWANDEIAARVTDPALALQTSHLLTETSFRYVDAVSEGVVGAYQLERERWVAHRSAVQRETVETLLRGDQVDLAGAEAALGYRLRQHHVGLVLWRDSGTDALAGGERLLARVAQRIGAVGHPLFVLRDRDTAWAWLPLGRSPELDVDALRTALAETTSGIRAAVGIPGSGEAGFRASHRGAAAAHRVAQLGAQDAVLVSFADPSLRAAALLTGDLEATRALVIGTLGRLAAATPSAALLRETLLVFLQERESYVATAARLHLHKNTVRYRLERAVEERGRPLDQERLDLELALIACRWLAPEVLLAR